MEASWGVLEAFLGVLEVFWGVLGILEPSGGRLESILNRLGGLLAGLGPKKVANMGAFWHPKRRKNRLKIGPKIDSFYDASWNRFYRIFSDFWLQKSTHVGPKMY